MKSADEPEILLDADVIRHFMKGGQIHKLVQIFPDRLVLLETVRCELCRSRHLQTPVTNFIGMFKIKVVHLSKQTEVVKEYAQLKSKGKGDGESACLATARYEKKYIASSNLKDIKDYCETYEIPYYTTMDILVESIEKGILCHDECNQFISDVLAKGSKLPYQTMQDFYNKRTPKPAGVTAKRVETFKKAESKPASEVKIDLPQDSSNQGEKVI